MSFWLAICYRHYGRSCLLPPCSGYCSTTLAALSETAVTECQSTRRHSNLQPYRTFNFDVLGAYIWKGMIILCTKHTPRQALLIKSKISHSIFNERTVGDTSEIVIVTGRPVCTVKWIRQWLVEVCSLCVSTQSEREKMLMKVIYRTSATAYLVSNTDWSIDTVCAWKLYLHVTWYWRYRNLHRLVLRNPICATKRASAFSSFRPQKRKVVSNLAVF
jgi:hypothetical protein